LTLLGIARDADLARALVSDSVRTFLTTSPEPLVETARVYLEEAANVVRTATRLNLHRQTVYHRLDSIGQATGLDLATGADRLTLHLAVVLAPYVLPGNRESARGG
jgi:DNA-binding PucR family transcriptional regulator